MTDKDFSRNNVFKNAAVFKKSEGFFFRKDVLMELKETYNEARRLFTKDSEDYFHGFCRYFKLQFGGKDSTLCFTSSPTPFYASNAGYQHPYSDKHLTRTFFSHKDHDQEQNKIMITNLLKNVVFLHWRD